MTYKTLFGGYTPELDLSASDWTKRWSSVATATVLGVSYEFIDSAIDVSDSATYTFPGIVSSAGTYIVVVACTGGGSNVGLQGVSVDGQLGIELLELTTTEATLSFWRLTPTSFADGDINVLANAVHARCAIAVFQLHGGMASYSSNADGNALGVSDSLVTTIRNVLIGGAIKQGNLSSTQYYWGGPIRERIDALIEGSGYWTIADRLLLTDEVTAEFNLQMDAAPTAVRWGVLNFQTPITYFPSGQGVRFQKQTSDARSFWSWDTAGRLDDVEILSLVRSPSSSGTFFSSGVMARAGGTLNAEDGYGFLLSQPSANARSLITIQRLVAGTNLTIAQATFNWSLNTNYWMRFKLRGSTLQGRVWAEGTVEPTTWNLTVTDTSHSIGYVGVFHFEVLSQLEVGHFEVRRLYTEWPYDTVPFNWTVDMSGGPQSNKVSFKPDVGPNIERRRASAIARKYQVECPGLSQAEYIAFLEFYHTTLKEGTLVFMARDPFTGEDKLWKFGDDDPAYTESFQRPVGEDFDEGVYKLMFNVVRLD